MFVLQCPVVVLGTQLSISSAARAGLQSPPVMLGTLAACLAATYIYGRLLGVTGNLRTLIGVGTGVCGGSAIAAPGRGAARMSPARVLRLVPMLVVNDRPDGRPIPDTPSPA